MEEVRTAKSLRSERTGAEMWLVPSTLCDSANKGLDLSEKPEQWLYRAYDRAALPHGDAMDPACGISPTDLARFGTSMRIHVSW